MSIYQQAGRIGKRMALTPNGKIRYQLKTPYRDGTTHVIFEPQEALQAGIQPHELPQERAPPVMRLFD